MLSIIIPSRNEKYLNVTIKDLQAKATGPIEIIVALDGADAPRLDGVKYIYFPESIGMKYAINAAVELATGEYLMKLDGHCVVAPGFDKQLIADHQPDWIQIPRRYRLNEEAWEPDFNEFVDYEYWIWPPKYRTPSLHGFRWRVRAITREKVLIDDTLTFQGSCWFMTRAWWDKMDFMHDEGYNQLHAQEAAYLGTATWYAGGRVVVNKKTWYAHLHKTKESGRGYHMDEPKRRACYKYSYNHWVNERPDQFIKLIEKFSPLPGWPQNWTERLYPPSL